MFLAYEVMLGKKIQNKSYFQPSINNQHAWRTSYPFFLFVFFLFKASWIFINSYKIFGLNKGQAMVYWNEAVHFLNDGIWLVCGDVILWMAGFQFQYKQTNSFKICFPWCCNFIKEEYPRVPWKLIHHEFWWFDSIYLQWLFQIWIESQ